MSNPNTAELKFGNEPLELKDFAQTLRAFNEAGVVYTTTRHDDGAITLTIIVGSY